MARVVLGFPMYGSGEVVGSVLESLLALDYDDYAIVAIDDASPDDTFAIASRYAANDSRLVVERNDERVGMIPNWNRTLQRAYELHPEFEYFAWASDNDLREPGWISALVRELESHQDAALAYSRFGIADSGRKNAEESRRWLFETRGIESPRERFVATISGLRAGPIMYGLHRRRTLDAAGDVPPILLSDFIFLSHLSLYGSFVQAPEVLWYRDVRRTTGSSPRRQRAALFAGPPPRLTYLPLSLQHTVWLFRRLLIERRRPGGVGGVAAIGLCGTYLWTWYARLGRRGRHELRKRRRKLIRRLRKRLHPYKKRVKGSPLVRRALRRRR